MFHNHPVKAALAVVLALCAIAAPAATARVIPTAPACSNCAYGPIADLAYLHPATGAPATVHVEPQPGFDWGDAAIGAAAGIALSCVGLGGALTISQRQRQRRRAGRSTAALG